MIDVGFDFQSRRSPVVGLRGMVAASQPLAVQAGLEVLAKGGAAADAAVATAAALAVTEPMATGIGGDAFVLYYQASTRQVLALNGSGRAPAALTLERLHRDGLEGELPPQHPYTVTVPGAVACWHDLVAAHGRLSLSAVLAPAVRLADEGFPVAPLTARSWQLSGPARLLSHPGGGELLLDGAAPQPGQIFRNPGLARALRRIGELGPEPFYRGEIARSIAYAVQAAGGVLSEDDLARHHSTWDEPISITYRGLCVWECPPNGQGLVALLALNLLEGFDLAHLEPLSPERLHLVIEALRLGFADAFWHVADPAFAPAPLEALLSRSYAAERRRAIDLTRAGSDRVPGFTSWGSDTVYLSVVDGEGNACSFINSLFEGFGSGIVPVGWGFALQNRGRGFRLDPDHPDALAPGKRPYHTIIPAMVTDADGALYASLGVMGGFMQPQGHTQVLIGLIDDALDPQAALDRPRVCLQGTFDLVDGPVALEEGIPESTKSALEERGHRVEYLSGYGRRRFGLGQIIRRDPQSGVLWAGSDPRADGCAMALG